MDDDLNITRPPDPVSALSQVEDDQTLPHEATLWAIDELIAGRSFEQVHADLIEQNWSPTEAERIIETARKETRVQRGVITRDDVVRDLNVDYRRATGGLSVAFRSGLFGLYGFTTGFMSALRSLRKLKGFLARKKPNPSDPIEK